MKKINIDKILDESYKSINKFTDYNKFTDQEKKEIDVFFNEIKILIKNIDQKKDKKFNVNLYESFKNIIDNGIKDD